MLPQDPMLLLSYINTKLRDEYPDLETLCEELDADKEEIVSKLAAAGYRYNRELNTFK